jgi:hypothetical protein
VGLTAPAYQFDANAILSAMEAPTLRLGRFLYRGRLLSIEQWLPFWERLQELENAPVADGVTAVKARMRARTAFHRAYLRAVFPRRDFKFWAPDPVAQVLAQPFDLVEKIVSFFFILQARATFGTTIDEPMTTNGTSSPPVTPAPRSDAASA